MATKVTERDDASSSEPGAHGTTRTPFALELYRSALGKKYVMAITGVVWMAYVFAHMVGNLKMYFGQEEFDHYAEFLRRLVYPIVPESTVLWIMRLILIAALVLHVLAAYQLTVMNKRARPDSYRSRRDWIAADFASRTMRWTGVIVLLFIVYHVADLTFAWVNPEPTGTPFERLVASLSQPVVGGFYILANAVLGIHLYHGGWSLFQSMGWNNRRFNHWRRGFAIGFAAIVVIGNLSFPIAILAGVVR